MKYVSILIAMLALISSATAAQAQGCCNGGACCKAKMSCCAKTHK